MRFLETVRRAKTYLEDQGRVSLRALKLEFDLDDDQLEGLVEELVDVQRIAAREGRALAWAGPSTRAEAAAATGAAAPERNPRDYTPKHLAARILQSKSALEGERKHVTVLFADIKGSMELAEQVDPEEWHAVLDRYFQVVSGVVHRYEGTVNQYTGDGVMALFGAPIAHEDHAQRACYAALQLRDELRELGQGLRRQHGLDFAARIGLNSGDVVVGKIGDDLRMDYTAQGHTVGLAERMQQLAETGKPYLAEDTAALVAGYFRLEDLGEFRLKGVASPVRAYGLEGAGELRTRLDMSRSRGFSRFVGRDDEMAILEAALDRAVAGNGQVVGVVADAGVGKSRLCFEFAARCRARGIPVRHATGVAHGRAIPLLPILEFLRESFGILARDGDHEARQKIAGAIVLLDEELRDELPLLFDFLGVPDPERPAPALDPEQRQRRLLELVKRLSVARSQRQPAVLVFEDLHWIDPATQAFIEALADGAEGHRTLMIVNFRPEYGADWTHRSYFQQLALRPLDRSGIDEMLREWLGSDPSLRAVRERIAERTAGNPFFIEEVVRALIESGRLEGARGHYRAVADPEEIEIPATVQNVLAARIDRLGGREKQVLQTAAVIGDEFPEPLVERVAGLPRVELSDALRSLLQAEFLWERALYPELEYAFKHPLTQEVAAASLLRERRRRLHALVAGALEERHAGALDEKAALLAHHWEEAGEALAAARWYHRASDWLGLRDPTLSIDHNRRIGDLLADAPDSRETLELRLEALGWILVQRTRIGLEEGELEALIAQGNALVSRSDADSDLEASFLVSTGFALILEGRIREALECGERAYSLSCASGADGPFMIRPRGLLISALLHSGFVDRVLELLAPSLADLEGLEYAYFAPLVYANRGLVLAWAGRIDEALPPLQRAIERATDRGDLAAGGFAHGYQATLERWRGSPQAALAHGRQAVELAEQVGTPTGLKAACYQLGHALLCNGQLDEARAELERGLAIERGRGWEAASLAALAETRAGLGDLEGACEAAREAVAVAEATGQPEIAPRLALARALRCADGPASGPAIESALDRALELVEASGARIHRPEILEERAELARLRGDDAAREHELREARRLYTEMGASGQVARLRATAGSS
jgi:class 3 adenylate cyclase/tetratricopeptide (TPR) repeat protein